MRVDSFSTAPVDAASFERVFQQDVSLAPHLIKLWEDNRCRASRARPTAAPSPPARARLGSPRRVHQRPRARHARRSRQHDQLLRLREPPRRAGAETAYLADLVVPYLHGAWVRSQVDLAARPRRRHQARQDRPPHPARAADPAVDLPRQEQHRDRHDPRDTARSP